MNITKKRGDFLDILLRSKKTVFTTVDIFLLWEDTNIGATEVRLHYYVKTSKLIRLRRGLYAKDANYDRKELATNILRPSYISFETVLAASGMTFQYYNQIFVASYIKREIVCDGQIYTFETIKKNALINPLGIDQSREYSIATPERAFLDTVYRSKDYHFDNLSSLNWEKVFAMVHIYENKKMERKIKQYYKNFLKTN